ncbi:hypothetical protein PVAP13_5NG205381 [Panicum virgatum]|uniref:Secreted protein n=1 Tax=Panicum virgatum TaxID=38727 RepID=A0A8T0RUL9_PANVG|nr:hypothetical protein PVAP13_5NG205381 [Panicum virgatum]
MLLFSFLFFSFPPLLFHYQYFTSSIPSCNFWSAPIHALIIYSKENHRQRYLRKETLMFIYSRTEVGTAMKTLHVVLVGHEHGHDKKSKQGLVSNQIVSVSTRFITMTKANGSFLFATIPTQHVLQMFLIC